MMSKVMKRVVLSVFIAGVFVMSGCSVSSEPVMESVEPDEESVSEVERKTAEFEVNGKTVCVDYTDAEQSFLEELEKEFYLYRLYDSSELTGEMLENRNGDVIVERCIGIVENKETGDGRLLNYPDPDYYYISYSRMDEVRDGTIVLSYMVYDPDNNYTDGIMERYDFVLSRELEDWF